MVNRATFVQLVEAQVKKWEAEIQELELRANLLEKSAQDEMKKQVSYLREKLLEAEVILTEIEQATEETWNRVGNQLVTSLEEIKNTMEEAFSKYLINQRSG